MISSLLGLSPVSRICKSNPKYYSVGPNYTFSCPTANPAPSWNELREWVPSSGLPTTHQALPGAAMPQAAEAWAGTAIQRISACSIIQAAVSQEPGSASCGISSGSFSIRTVGVI